MSKLHTQTEPYSDTTHVKITHTNCAIFRHNPCQNYTHKLNHIQTQPMSKLHTQTDHIQTQPMSKFSAIFRHNPCQNYTHCAIFRHNPCQNYTHKLSHIQTQPMSKLHTNYTQTAPYSDTTHVKITHTN